MSESPRQPIDPHDICECGDWRYQHLNGPCIFADHCIPGGRNEPLNRCTKFRIFKWARTAPTYACQPCLDEIERRNAEEASHDDQANEHRC